MNDLWWLWDIAGIAVAAILTVHPLPGTFWRGRHAAAAPVDNSEPVRWSPANLPMGLVSSWPHNVGHPKSVPSQSPADRPDLAR